MRFLYALATGGPMILAFITAGLSLIVGLVLFFFGGEGSGGFPGRVNRRGRKIGASFLLVFTLLLLTFIVIDMAVMDGYIKMPDVVGWRYDKAKDKLKSEEGRGFHVSLEWETDLSFVVKSQSPAAGDIVKEKTEVKLLLTEGDFKEHYADESKRFSSAWLGHLHK